MKIIYNERDIQLATSNGKAQQLYRVDPGGGVKRLYVMVYKSGRKVFYLRTNRRVNGVRKYYDDPIGNFGQMSLPDAMRQAMSLNVSISYGTNIVAERREARREFQQAMTLREAIDAFSDLKSGQVEIEKTRKRLYRYVPGDLMDRLVSTLTPGDFEAMADRIRDNAGEKTARRILMNLNTSFNAIVSRHQLAARAGITVNPVATIDKSNYGVDRLRLRTLSPHELRSLWRHIDQCRSYEPTKDALRLRLLTGQRSKEVVAACRRDVELSRRLWTIPETKAGKGKRDPRPQKLPLAPMAFGIVVKRLQYSDSRWLFPTKFKTKNVHVADTSIWGICDQWWGIYSEEHKLDDEQPGPHDLRRTMATVMEEQLKVSHRIVKAVLNHKDPSVTARYSVGELIDEKREALERWEGYLARVFQAASNNALSL